MKARILAIGQLSGLVFPALSGARAFPGKDVPASFSGSHVGLCGHSPENGLWTICRETSFGASTTIASFAAAVDRVVTGLFLWE
jgi:hypothetical protein